MATVKTPEERGPLGAWAYDSRDRLDISPEQVVELLGKYDTSTIRKAEGNSEAMSRPLWRSLTGLYARLASERGVTLDAMPTFGEPDTAGDQSLATALTLLVGELAEWRKDRVELMSRLRAAEAELELLRGKPTGAELPEQPLPLGSAGSDR